MVAVGGNKCEHCGGRMELDFEATEDNHERTLKCMLCGRQRITVASVAQKTAVVRAQEKEAMAAATPLEEKEPPAETNAPEPEPAAVTPAADEVPPGGPLDIEEWKKKNNYKRAAWFKKHREAITQALKDIGVPGVTREWGISESSSRSIIRRWDIQGVRLYHRGLRGPQKKPRKPPGEQKVDRQLQSPSPFPQFPPFNDDWNMLVQIKWLEVYPEIYREVQANAHG